MEQQEWVVEARRYSKLPAQARAQYWEQLTPAQREALEAALAQINVKTRSRGCGGPVVAGCAGMVLGVVLTIGAEIALVMMGVQAVVDSLEGLSTTGSASSTAPAPISVEDANPYELLQYCGTEWEEQYERIAYVCWENEVNERINERVYREKTRDD